MFVIFSPHDHSTAVWSNATHRNYGLNFVSTLPEYGPVGFREDENMKSLQRHERQQTKSDHKIPLVSGELKSKNFDEKKNKKVFVVVYK